MWRLANCIYRAFRNTATHRCPQDVFVPLSTICNTDDDKDAKKDAKESQTRPCDIYQLLKQNQFSYSNIDKLQEYLRKFSVQKILAHKLVVVKPVEPPKTVQSFPSIEQTLESLVSTDATCTKTVKELSDLHDETMSIINLEMALNALESGNVQFGIEALQASAKSRTNAAALYNLGLCYEQGIGVGHDRAKACDHFRWATALGHKNAQLHLSRLSNDIDLDDDNDVDADDTLTKASGAHPDPAFFRWTSPPIEQTEHRFDFQNQAVACLA